MGEQVLIVGAGNWMYGDEAAGIIIANELGRRLGDFVKVTYDLGRVLGYLHIQQPKELEQIIFTTMAAEDEDHPSGSWCRLDMAMDTSRTESSWLTGTRSLKLPEMVDLARRVAAHGVHTTIYVQFGSDFRLGAPLSLPVKKAIEAIEDRIEEEIRAGQSVRSAPSRRGLSATAPF
ncbi:MAG: hypothetical protein HJJLKODD_02981 [Phycisphaerae bacterium]|nr:hypothetical protein [Phycisphaerae bacterium]